MLGMEASMLQSFENGYTHNGTGICHVGAIVAAYFLIGWRGLKIHVARSAITSQSRASAIS
jgi:hypothetical protein